MKKKKGDEKEEEEEEVNRESESKAYRLKFKEVTK